MQTSDSAAIPPRKAPASEILSGLQIGAFILFAQGMNQWMTHWHVPVPGSVAGMLLLLALLLGKWIRPSWLERGAHSLRSHLVVMFVPAMLGLLAHPELLSMMGLKLLTATVIGTPLVMTGTALVVEMGFRFQAHEAK